MLGFYNYGLLLRKFSIHLKILEHEERQEERQTG